MSIIREPHLQWNTAWTGDKTGLEVTLQHVPSGLIVRRVVGSHEPPGLRQEMRTELHQIVEVAFPSISFHFCNMNLGPGLGAAIRLDHIPTGKHVTRNVGYSLQNPMWTEMIAELIGMIQADSRK